MVLFTLVSRFNKFKEFGAGIIYANMRTSHSALKRYVFEYQMGIRKYSLGASYR